MLNEKDVQDLLLIINAASIRGEMADRIVELKQKLLKLNSKE